MRCGNCGAENPEESRFCSACGRPLGASAQPPRAEDEIEREVSGLRAESTPAGRRRVLSKFDQQLEQLTGQGWQILSQTDTSAQLKGPKQWSRIGLLVFVLLPLVGGLVYTPLIGVAVIGLVFVLLDYLLRKDRLVYLSGAKLSRGEALNLNGPSPWTGPFILGGILILIAAVCLFGSVWLFSLWAAAMH